MHTSCLSNLGQAADNPSHWDSEAMYIQYVQCVSPCPSTSSSLHLPGTIPPETTCECRLKREGTFRGSNLRGCFHSVGKWCLSHLLEKKGMAIFIKKKKKKKLGICWVFLIFFFLILEMSRRK